MNFIIAGFEGNRNSAKLFLDKLSPDYKKMYLRNDRTASVSQIVSILDKSDYVFAIGQKPVIKDKICIELLGRQEGTFYKTKFPIHDLISFFQGQYSVKISQNAGTSLCNNIYYNALKYIDENSLNTKILFIHIPTLNNITDFGKLTSSFESYLNSSPLLTK